jgi:hypothetical protein
MNPVAAPATTSKPLSTIKLPGNIEIDLATTKAGKFKGLGQVRAGGVPLRTNKRAWRPFFATPQGLSYIEFAIVSTTPTPTGGVTLEMAAIGQPTPIAEETDEYLCDIVDLSLPDEPVTDKLWIDIEPSKQTIGGKTLTGFKYRYRFELGEGRKIYRLFDEATWEIGGELQGNTLVFQGQCNPPAPKLTKEGYFTTACNYYGAEMGVIMGPPKRVSFQRLPRVGTLQAFDFLSHPEGILVGLFEPMVEVLSILQTTTGEDYLHIVDEHRFDMTDKGQTIWKHMVFLHGGLKKHAERNLWSDILDQEHDKIRARYGVVPSPILPRVWIPQVSKEVAEIDGIKFPREHALREMADRWIPRWAAMGVKEICCHSMWVSDYTVDRFKTKADEGMHGALNVGSICNVRVHEIDATWGGPEAVKYFCDKAHAHGIMVQLWFATHLGRRAPIFKERPDFMLMAKDGLPNGGGFGHQTIITVDLNNPEAFKFILDKLVTLHKQTGFDGFFHDSYGNMTFLPIGFNTAHRRGQQDAYGRLVHELQKAGMKTFTAEGIGALAVPHFGMGLLGQHAKRGNYQYALEWWLQDADMAFRLSYGIGTTVWTGEMAEYSEPFSFDCLAYGGRFGFTQYEKGWESWSGWVLAHNKIGGQIDLRDARREILEDHTGVLWHHKASGKQTFFAIKEMSLKIPAGKTVKQITPEGLVDVTVKNGLLQAPKHTVYAIA